MNAAHYRSLSGRTPLTAGKALSVSWNAVPQDGPVKAGHRTAVIPAGNDSNYTSNVASTPQVTVHLERSTVTLPFAGDPVNPQITAAPAVQR